MARKKKVEGKDQKSSSPRLFPSFSSIFTYLPTDRYPFMNWSDPCGLLNKGLYGDCCLPVFLLARRLNLLVIMDARSFSTNSPALPRRRRRRNSEKNGGEGVPFPFTSRPPLAREGGEEDFCWLQGFMRLAGCQERNYPEKQWKKGSRERGREMIKGQIIRKYFRLSTEWRKTYYYYRIFPHEKARGGEKN